MAALCAYVHRSGVVCGHNAYDSLGQEPRCAKHRTGVSHAKCSLCDAFTNARSGTCTQCRDAKAAQGTPAPEEGLAASGRAAATAKGGVAARSIIEQVREEKERQREHLLLARLPGAERTYLLRRGNHEDLSLLREHGADGSYWLVECGKGPPAKEVQARVKQFLAEMSGWGVFGRLTAEGGTWLSVELDPETCEEELVDLCRGEADKTERCAVS